MTELTPLEKIIKEKAGITDAGYSKYQQNPSRLSISIIECIDIAEEYARRLLEKAADEAVVIYEPEISTGEMWPTTVIDKESITNTKL